MASEPGINADLHCHSLVSDGLLGPADLARRAHANGVVLWALTDHDELAGVHEARRSAESLGMSFVSGVEISATWANRTIHVVGLRVDPDNAELNAGLAGIRADRLSRGRVMADRLEALGFKGAYEGAMRHAESPSLLARTHFARFLVESGHCTHIQQAFDRYLGDGKPANVRIDWASLRQAVRWIHAAGGRAVLAHPGRYAYTAMQFDALFSEFKDLGGEGIEVVTGSHRPEQYREYADVARRFGFLASRGSDFHAPGESRIDLGKLPPLPDRLVPIWHDWV